MPAAASSLRWDFLSGDSRSMHESELRAELCSIYELPRDYLMDRTAADSEEEMVVFVEHSRAANHSQHCNTLIP